MSETRPNSKHEAHTERMDLRAELESVERLMETLRVQYEQYFTGLIPRSPDSSHNEVKRRFRRLMKAPFKNSEINFKMRALESRFNTLNSYWKRVLRQREEGNYSKDVFKANMRERHALEDARAQTSVGKADAGVKNLFKTYQEQLQKTSGHTQNLDFNAFQKVIVQKAKEFKEAHGNVKVSFSISVRDGRVILQAKKKQEQ